MRKQSHKRIDMSGKIYNSWKIIEVDHQLTKGKVLYWKAECLGCNRLFSVHGANVRNGLSKRCADCGCGHGHAKQLGQIRTKRTPEDSAHYYLFLRLRKDARRRNLSWDLSETQTKTLVLQNCTYCGIEPSLECRPLEHMQMSQKLAKEATLTRNGIDRVDSSKGYVWDNVVPCCEQCNKAKLAMSKEEFTAWFHRLALHQGYKR